MEPLPQNPNGNGRFRSQSFVRGMKQVLQQSNFTDQAGICWTTHNYGDVFCDIGENSLDPSTRASGRGVAGQTNAHLVQRELVGWWRGWPYGDTTEPYVLITEGGCFIIKAKERRPENNTPDELNALHSALLLRNWKRMKGTFAGYSAEDAAGIGMVPGGHTWYAVSRAADDDAALCEPSTPPTNGLKRPAYEPDRVARRPFGLGQVVTVGAVALAREASPEGERSA